MVGLVKEQRIQITVRTSNAKRLAAVEDPLLTA